MSLSPALVDEEMQVCIEECMNCHVLCVQSAMLHGPEMGHDYIQPEHLRLLLGCAEICRTAAYFLMGGCPEASAVCGACVEVCEACAKSCDRLGDLDECAELCRSTAAHCRRMAD